jgi:hypothetical protein
MLRPPWLLATHACAPLADSSSLPVRPVKLNAPCCLPGKLRLLLAMCERLRVHIAPACVEGVWIVPLLSWYHPSFDKEADVPGAVPIEKARPPTCTMRALHLAVIGFAWSMLGRRRMCTTLKKPQIAYDVALRPDIDAPEPALPACAGHARLPCVRLEQHAWSQPPRHVTRSPHGLPQRPRLWCRGSGGGSTAASRVPAPRRLGLTLPPHAAPLATQALPLVP